MSTVSSLVYVFIRMASLALTVMTFHLGLTRQAEIAWNTPQVRIFALGVVSLLQVEQKRGPLITLA